MKTLKFEFTLEQVNSMLNALASIPYIQSAGLINLIQNQAGPQVREMQIAEAGEKNEPTPAA